MLGEAVRIEDVDGKQPWLVKLAHKLSSKDPNLVVAKGQKTCALLLILNLLAELGSWSIQFLAFIG